MNNSRLPPSFWEQLDQECSDEECSDEGEIFEVFNVPPPQDPFGMALYHLLDEVFPKSIRVHGANISSPIFVGRRLHQQYVGFRGNTDINTGELRWEAFWEMKKRNYDKNFLVGNRPIHSLNGAAAWLSGTHHQIMKLSCEIIKEAIHPDNFMPKPLQAFGAAYDLGQIGVSAQEATDRVKQPLPWSHRGPDIRSNKFAIRVLRASGRATSTKVGYIILGLKDTWRYGAQINVDFRSSRRDSIKTEVLALSFEQRPDHSTLPSGNVAKAQAKVEHDYAFFALVWLMTHATYEDLRPI